MNELELSKGIPSDIDLTMDSIFQNGAKELFPVRRKEAGIIPWDENGKVKKKSPFLNNYLYKPKIKTRGIGTYFYNEFYESEDDFDLSDSIKELKSFLKNHKLTEETIPFYLQSLFTLKEQYPQLLELFEITNTNLYMKNDNSSEYYLIPSSDQYNAQIITLTNYNVDYMNVDYSTSSSNYSLSTNSTYSTLSNTVLHEITISDDTYFVDNYDIPSYITGIYSDDPSFNKFEISNVNSINITGNLGDISFMELYYDKIITGSQEEIRRKTIKKNFINECCKIIYGCDVSELLSHKKQKASNDDILRKFRKEIFPENDNKTKSIFLLKSRQWENEKVLLEEKDYRKRSSYVMNIFIREEKFDYFEQPIYREQGVDLIRIPPRSHELRVDLNTGEVTDDDSDEIRRVRSRLVFLHEVRKKFWI